MAKLLLSMNGQTLTVKKTIGQIIEKSHQYLEYEFEKFSSDWNGVVKEVIFTHGKDSIKATSNYVPDEVIQAPGFLVSVVGYLGSGNKKRLIITTNSVPVQVHLAGATDGDLPSSSNPEANWLEEVKSYAQEFRNWLDFGMGKNIEYKIPFTEYNTSTDDNITIIKDIRPRFIVNNTGEIVEDNTISMKFSPIMKCPKYLGFRIERDARLYLYIGTMQDNNFVLKEDYLFNVTEISQDGDSSNSIKVVNYLSEAYNTFLKTEDNEYFYYRIKDKEEVNDEEIELGKVTIYGADEFPQSEINGVATTNQFAISYSEDSGTGDEPEVSNLPISTQGRKYYGAVLPAGCFYAILNNVKPNDEKNAPSYANPEDEKDPDIQPTRPTFNISYQRSGSNVEIIKGASFGYIPDDVGAALLRFPTTYTLDDFVIYTDKKVKSNADSGRRKKARDIGKKIAEDFYFSSQKEIFWNDSVRPMKIGRRFYGVPYSSRWANSHYVGFEVSPTTAFNALNNRYSVAYEGGFTLRRKGDMVDVWENIAANEATGKARSTEEVSSHSEILGDLYNPKDGGGPGYGLVCSAFTCLINGNPYPQTNRGYTFDDNFVIENTIDMNSGEVLVNKGLTHCVFVDETYDNGFSLYEAVDPCVAKTIHTALEENALYAKSKVRTNYLDNYIYSVVNKDISGYDKKLMVENDPNSEDRLALLKNFDVTSFETPLGKVRPWRGHMSVYGPWDKETVLERTYQGSGIGLTLDSLVDSFTLKFPSGKSIVFIKAAAPEIGKDDYKYKFTDLEDKNREVVVKNSCYVKLANIPIKITEPNGDTFDLITENGEYEVIDDTGIVEKFRYYNHDIVRLTFDTEGKAIFKNSDGSIAEDVEYVYVDVIGYGAGFDDTDYAKFDFNEIDENTIDLGGMVIAKGKKYPDLALYPKRIRGIYAAIVPDISTDKRANIKSWGKYSCVTSTDIISDYRGDINVIDTIQENVDGIKILKSADFENGSLETGGYIASDYWIITTPSIPVKIGDKITVKPNGFKVWMRIQDSDDVSVAINLENLGGKTENFEYESNYDGWVVIQVGKIDGSKIMPAEYDCDIRIGKTSLEQTNRNTQEIENLKKMLEEGRKSSIIEITEDTNLWELEDGVYHIDFSSGATIYYDEVESNGLQDGLLLVNYSGDYGYYHFIAIGRDTVWDVGTFVGEIELKDGYWAATYYKPENSNSRVTRISEYTNNNRCYPTVKLMTEYVDSAIADLKEKEIDYVKSYTYNLAEFEGKKTTDGYDLFFLDTNLVPTNVGGGQNYHVAAGIGINLFEKVGTSPITHFADSPFKVTFNPSTGYIDVINYKNIIDVEFVLTDSSKVSFTRTIKSLLNNGDIFRGEILHDIDGTKGDVTTCQLIFAMHLYTTSEEKAVELVSIWQSAIDNGLVQSVVLYYQNQPEIENVDCHYLGNE